jgi:hypothetical protein
VSKTTTKHLKENFLDEGSALWSKFRKVAQAEGTPCMVVARPISVSGGAVGWAYHCVGFVVPAEGDIVVVDPGSEDQPFQDAVGAMAGVCDVYQLHTKQSDPLVKGPEGIVGAALRHLGVEDRDTQDLVRTALGLPRPPSSGEPPADVATEAIGMLQACVGVATLPITTTFVASLVGSAQRYAENGPHRAFLVNSGVQSRPLLVLAGGKNQKNIRAIECKDGKSNMLVENVFGYAPLTDGVEIVRTEGDPRNTVKIHIVAMEADGTPSKLIKQQLVLR